MDLARSECVSANFMKQVINTSYILREYYSKQSKFFLGNNFLAEKVFPMSFKQSYTIYKSKNFAI